MEHDTYPSLMGNSTSNKNIYGSVAVTAIGNTFGVVHQDGQVDSIRTWRLADDTVNWSLTTNVDLDGAWR